MGLGPAAMPVDKLSAAALADALRVLGRAEARAAALGVARQIAKVGVRSALCHAVCCAGEWICIPAALNRLQLCLWELQAAL